MTDHVRTEILGQKVEGRVVDDRIAGEYGAGARRELIVDIGGARHVVEEADVEPIPSPMTS